MFKRATRLAINTMTVVWAGFATLLLLSGYSDRTSPEVWEWAPVLGLLFPILLAANLLYLFLFLTFCWRRAWLPVVAFLLVFPALKLYLPLHFGSRDLTDPDGATLSVMSYNVQGFNGPGIVDDPKSENLGHIIEYLKQQTPDILCLQECTGSWRGSITRLDSLYAHFDTVTVFRNKSVSNAVGIFTHHRILKKERIEYPSQGNGSVAWQLKRGDDTLLVVNNHLETNHLNKKIRQEYRSILHGEEQADSMRSKTKNIMGILIDQAVFRAPQAHAVAQYTDSVMQLHPGWLVIVCGDFNEPPVSYAHHTIAHGLTDCFEAAGCGPGWSMLAKAFPVRIDNILCNQRLKPLACRVDRSLTASDHYPIFATMEIIKRED